MIEQATVDAYNESEQITGWFTMIDENLAVPFETALRHARSALATGTDDAMTLATAAFIVAIEGHDFDAARGALDRALAINPNSALALGRSAQVRMLAGHYDKAIDEANRSIRLSPFAYPHDLPVQTPVLVVAGSDDPIVPPANGELLAKLLPHCRNELIKGGHLVWEDAPAAYAARLATWFGGEYRSV
jgi:pimeloyl-ACP methyl ester carboxylesterase